MGKPVLLEVWQGCCDTGDICYRFWQEKVQLQNLQALQPA